jgi:hypothetical protein
MASANEIAQRIAKGLVVHGFENDEGAEDAIMSNLPLIEKTIKDGIGDVEANKMEEVRELLATTRAHVAQVNDLLQKLANKGVSAKLEEREHRSVSKSACHYTVSAFTSL